MEDKNSKTNEDGKPSITHLNTPGHGPQGVDKAPGEEDSEDNVQFTQETQKGKKVDGDPSQETDKPINQPL
jgi:hypothetical protein